MSLLDNIWGPGQRDDSTLVLQRDGLQHDRLPDMEVHSFEQTHSKHDLQRVSLGHNRLRQESMPTTEVKGPQGCESQCN